MISHMDMKTPAIVFGMVFLAKLGDKSQLATLLFSTKKPVSLLTVFVGATTALALATSIAVVAGAFISSHIDTNSLSIPAGLGFMTIGAWTLCQA